jgi:hypothetical protein
MPEKSRKAIRKHIEGKNRNCRRMRMGTPVSPRCAKE